MWCSNRSFFPFSLTRPWVLIGLPHDLPLLARKWRSVGKLIASLDPVQLLPRWCTHMFVWAPEQSCPRLAEWKSSSVIGWFCSRMLCTLLIWTVSRSIVLPCMVAYIFFPREEFRVDLLQWKLVSIPVWSSAYRPGEYNKSWVAKVTVIDAK